MDSFSSEKDLQHFLEYGNYRSFFCAHAFDFYNDKDANRNFKEVLFVF